MPKNMSHHSHDADWRASFGGASSSFPAGAVPASSPSVSPPSSWGSSPQAPLSSQDPLLGQMIHRLQLVQKVGQGGFGAVYRAVHLDTQHSFAVKVMNLNLQGHEEAVERFRREARAMGQLQHPNVVRVEEFGFLEGYNFYFLVMEYLEGRTLQRVIKKHEPIQGDWILQTAYQLCSALDYIHTKNIIHRDLKPGNVFLVPSAQGEIVKLLDFGIAAMAEDGSLTQSGACMGSPTYMSPEQAEGNTRHVDARADIYSLGILLYELFTGRPPFRGDSFAALLRQHLLDPPPTLAQVCPHQGWVPELEGVFQKVLEKAPQDRYPHIQAFWADFEVAFRKQLETFGYQQPSPDMTVAENFRDSFPSALPSGQALSGGQSLHDSHAQSASGRQRLLAGAASSTPLGTMSLPGTKGAQPKSSSHKSFFLGVAGAVVVAVVVLVLFALQGRGKENQLLLPPAPNTPNEGTSEARVLIKSDPLGASVWNKREYLCRTPCPLLGKAGEIRLLTLKRQGYLDKKIEVPFPMQGSNVLEFLMKKPEAALRRPSLATPPRAVRVRSQGSRTRSKKRFRRTRRVPSRQRVSNKPPARRTTKPFGDVGLDI
ncbi:MAG: serine/threonine protein kinase [Myxococcales bacterium]|nr:serine/threonine protein kinase [Myxococcales bacterium]MCB9642538.1 serine/threonine protein kinase [Myxococcales bacterium]